MMGEIVTLKIKKRVAKPKKLDWRAHLAAGMALQLPESLTDALVVHQAMWDAYEAMHALTTAPEDP
jgi:hypothetical protein